MGINEKNIGRRQILRGMAGLSGVAAAGSFLNITRPAFADEYEITIQLGWLISNGQLGEVAAEKLGYYKDAGLSLNIKAGGPNIDGVASVASKRANLGNISSSPSLMLARSAGIPIKCIAVGYQQHPFTYFSLKSNPINTPQDMIGKTIAMPGTARILLRALLAKHDIPEDQVEVAVMGSDFGPLMTGQVDAVAGWASNIAALDILGDQRNDMRLWDAGVQLYANPYYVHDDVLEEHSEQLAAFIAATGKGWAWVSENPQQAVEFLTTRFPNLNAEAEKRAVGVILEYVFNEETKANGWGAMSAENWANQIQIYADLGQFKNSVPSVDDVMTTTILEATTGARPKLG